MGNLKVGEQYYYHGDLVMYVEDVKLREGYCVVDAGGDYGEISVARKKDLIPKEESYQWKEKQKYADELRLITAKAEENLDAIVEKVIAKACSSLKTRIKMNVLFSKDTSTDGWALVIANELDKLVKEKAKDVIKDKELF